MPTAKSSLAPKSAAGRRQSVLVVDDEPAMLELTFDLLARWENVRTIQAGSLAEARRILARESISLLIVDLDLPDGNGADLLNELRRDQPDASAMVITGNASLQSSLDCFRDGAADYLPKPFGADEFRGRIERALRIQSDRVRSQRRMRRLRSAVKKLGGARRMVGKKVDLLCNDLVTAYGDLARQFEDVRVKEQFRKTIEGAEDLEQMLCHAMDWLLRTCGYTNIAIYLSNEDGTYDLGAYMKFTISGSRELTEALKAGVIEQVARDEFLQWTDADAAAALSPQELDVIAGHGVMAANATYLGESLAAIVMFRDGKSPFTADDAATLRGIAPIFAQVLTTMAKLEEIDNEEDEKPRKKPKSEEASDEWIDDDAPKQKPRKGQPKKDDADWWKRGEAPPF